MPKKTMASITRTRKNKNKNTWPIKIYLKKQKIIKNSLKNIDRVLPVEYNPKNVFYYPVRNTSRCDPVICSGKPSGPLFLMR
jgi:hypothetical protein